MASSGHRSPLREVSVRSRGGTGHRCQINQESKRVVMKSSTAWLPNSSMSFVTASWLPIPLLTPGLSGNSVVIRNTSWIEQYFGFKPPQNKSEDMQALEFISSACPCPWLGLAWAWHPHGRERKHGFGARGKILYFPVDRLEGISCFRNVIFPSWNSKNLFQLQCCCESCARCEEVKKTADLQRSLGVLGSSLQKPSAEGSVSPELWFLLDWLCTKPSTDVNVHGIIFPFGPNVPWWEVV